MKIMHLLAKEHDKQKNGNLLLVSPKLVKEYYKVMLKGCVIPEFPLTYRGCYLIPNEET